MYGKKEITKTPYNPLEPKYKIRNEDGEVVDYGQIVGEKPKVPYFRTNKEEAEKNMSTKDIHGNTTGSKRFGAFHSRERR